MMAIKDKLANFGLTAGNSIVIGSGVMGAYGIRKSHDVDVVVDAGLYAQLKTGGRFQEKKYYGRPVLLDGDLEISASWYAVGANRDLQHLAKQAVIIRGVRYISLDFLLAVKRGWIAEGDGRQKDIDDVRLIEAYLNSLRDVQH